MTCTRCKTCYFYKENECIGADWTGCNKHVADIDEYRHYRAAEKRSKIIDTLMNELEDDE